MKDLTFNGKEHAEEFFFKSAFGTEETIEKIKQHFPSPYGYYNTSAGNHNLKFTKIRLFFCEYNLHCDFQQSDNKYRLQLYYSISNTQWLYWVCSILFVIIISTTKVLAHGDDTTNSIIFIVLLILINLFIKRVFSDAPASELLEACKTIKKELGAFIKLEIEP